MISDLHINFLSLTKQNNSQSNLSLNDNALFNTSGYCCNLLAYFVCCLLINKNDTELITAQFIPCQSSHHWTSCCNIIASLFRCLMKVTRINTTDIVNTQSCLCIDRCISRNHFFFSNQN